VELVAGLSGAGRQNDDAGRGESERDSFHGRKPFLGETKQRRY
jgi:hypothetical protein